MSHKPEIYYVYSHIMDDEVVYIGKGKGNRAWSEQRYIDEHSEWVLNCIHDEINFVKMISTRLTNKDALALEKELIQEMKPKFNTEGTTIKCPHCGTRVRSAAGLTNHIKNWHRSLL